MKIRKSPLFQENLNDLLARDFYGIVYPFFDPVTWINQNVLHHIMNKLLKIIPRQLYSLKKIVIIIAIFTFHLDFMKDILIANHVTNIYNLNDKGSDFTNFIIIILWLTTFVAGVTFGVIMIASMGQHIYGNDCKKMKIYEKVLMLSFLIIFCPFTITIVIYLDAKTMDKIKQNRHRFRLVLQSKLHRNDQVEKMFQVEAEYLKLVKKEMSYKNLCSRFYRLETALESTPQVKYKIFIIIPAQYIIFFHLLFLTALRQSTL